MCALTRTANLEHVRASPLAPPATNDIDFTLLAFFVCTFYAFPVLSRLFTRLPPGPRRITAGDPFEMFLSIMADMLTFNPIVVISNYN